MNKVDEINATETQCAIAQYAPHTHYMHWIIVFYVHLTFVCYVFTAVFNSFGISEVHNKLKVSRCFVV